MAPRPRAHSLATAVHCRAAIYQSASDDGRSRGKKRPTETPHLQVRWTICDPELTSSFLAHTTIFAASDMTMTPHGTGDSHAAGERCEQHVRSLDGGKRLRRDPHL